MKERISFAQLPPKLVEAMLAMESYVNSVGFDQRLVELIRVRVSQLNGCSYCLDRHYKEGIHAGETPLRLYSLPVWQETPFYTDKEQAALRWADAVTLLSESPIDDELVETLYRHFSRDELANLTMIVAQINSWNRLAKPFSFVPGEFQAG